MDRESGQAHRGQALEDSALSHHGPVVFNGWNFANGQTGARDRIHRGQRFLIHRLRMTSLLVPQICFISFVPDVSDQVRPRDGIGRLDEPRVGYRPEGLADVAGVGNVPVRGEEDGAEAAGIGGVAEGGIRRLRGSAKGRQGIRERILAQALGGDLRL